MKNFLKVFVALGLASCNTTIKTNEITYLKKFDSGQHSVGYKFDLDTLNRTYKFLFKDGNHVFTSKGTLTKIGYSKYLLNDSLKLNSLPATLTENFDPSLSKNRIIVNVETESKFTENKRRRIMLLVNDSLKFPLRTDTIFFDDKIKKLQILINAFKSEILISDLSSNNFRIRFPIKDEYFFYTNLNDDTINILDGNNIEWKSTKLKLELKLSKAKIPSEYHVLHHLRYQGR